MYENDYSISQQHYNRSIHSVEYLKEHGTCMDNIRDGNSNIPHAGRGAFATRLIKKGNIVAPGPLIHVPNKNLLNIPNITLSSSPDTPLIEQQQQILINYCFGHEDSSLLLCPILY